MQTFLIINAWKIMHTSLEVAKGIINFSGEIKAWNCMQFTMEGTFERSEIGGMHTSTRYSVHNETKSSKWKSKWLQFEFIYVGNVWRIIKNNIKLRENETTYISRIFMMRNLKKWKCSWKFVEIRGVLLRFTEWDFIFLFWNLVTEKELSIHLNHSKWFISDECSCLDGFKTFWAIFL